MIGLIRVDPADLERLASSLQAVGDAMQRTPDVDTFDQRDCGHARLASTLRAFTGQSKQTRTKVAGDCTAIATMTRQAQQAYAEVERAVGGLFQTAQSSEHAQGTNSPYIQPQNELARLSAIRDHFERLRQQRPLNSFEQALYDEAVSGLDRITKIANLENRQFLKLSAASGDERFIEVYGDLDKAKKVVVYVPGVSTDLDTIMAGGGPPEELQRKLTQLYGEEVAVIHWADYDVPSSIGPPAALPHGAESGVAPLQSLIAQLRSEGFATDDIGVIGHSYGSVVTGHAMKAPGGLDVGYVLMIGSPGTGAASRDDLGSPHAHVSAAVGPGDSISSAHSDFGAAGGLLGGLVGALFGKGPEGAGIGSKAGYYVGDAVPGMDINGPHGPPPTDPDFGASVVEVPTVNSHDAADYLDDPNILADIKNNLLKGDSGEASMETPSTTYA